MPVIEALPVEFQEPAKAVQRSRWRLAPGRRVSSTWLAATLLTYLGVAGFPLFIAQSPWADVTHYDVAARSLLEGGIAYRDVFDTNLPGMVWLHAAVQWLAGWDFETMRALDLVLVGAMAWAIGAWVRRIEGSGSAALWCATVIVAFYLSVPEWGHVQRDTWMLAPALVGLELRRRALTGAATPARRAQLALAEGAWWAVAAWLKPFVLIPAAAVWAASLAWQRGRGENAHATLREALWAAGGGALVIAAGILWLVRTGSFPYFWEVMTEWNPEYGGNHAYHWHARRDLFLLWWYASLPWSLILLVSTPVAVHLVWPGRRPDGSGLRGRLEAVLLSVCFLGWLAQVLLLQPRAHPYAFTPVLFLGIPLLWTLPRVPPHLVRVMAGVVALLIAWAADRHPLVQGDRLALWPAAVRHGSTPESRDAQSRIGEARGRFVAALGYVGIPSWDDLEKVAGYLRTHDVGDRALIAFHETTHPLYLMLDVTPGIRYMQFNLPIGVFTSKSDRILQELAGSPARFLVADLETIGFPWDGHLSLLPPEWAERYPWYYPWVFRAGRYVVYVIDRPPDALWR